MLEKIGHIKNPLTVIALFAGIAEVSGAAVLPFIEQPVQETYVWFLMGFPCLIVLLFYITLWCKHHVLYAPGDFRDESNFTMMFTAGAPQVVAMKSEAEVDAVLSEEFGQENVEVETPLAQQQGEVAPDSEANDRTVRYSLSDSPGRTGSMQGEAAEMLRVRDEVSGRVARAEHLALSKVASEMNLRFTRYMSPADMPSVVFDAVAGGPGQDHVVAEVKLVRGSISLRAVEKTFEKVESFYSRLSAIERTRFRFIFIVVEDVGDVLSAGNALDVILKLSRIYGFKTVVKFYRLEELEKNAGRGSSQ